MARTALTPVSLANLYAGALGAAAADLVWTAADTGNNNSVPLTGQELVLAWNTHASTTYTVTLTSVADRHGRTLDVAAYSILAGTISAFGPLLPEGWRQSDGNLYLQANNASVKFCVIKLKGVFST